MSDLAEQRRVALEALLREQGLGEPEAAIPRPEHRSEAVTSFAQERLWFLEQFQPGTSVYNIPAVVRLPGPVNVAALEQALNGVVARHEVLRTSFASREGQPVQVVAPEATVPLPLADLRQMPAQARELEAGRLVAQELVRPFRLDRGPLLRALLVRLADTDHLFALVMHHIVTDGWSMDIFFRELNALYEAYSAGREPQLPELRLQYADFARWQRERLRGERLEEQLAYWRPQLEGAPAVLELPTDHPRPAVQTFRGGVHAFAVPAPLVQRLEQLAQTEGATLFMALLAAFKALLARYSGSSDLVVGTPIASRGRLELEQLIGFFVNTLVLRTDCSGDPSYRELLQRVREVTLGAYAHQDLPFEQLVLELQPERRLSHNPLFQVMFIFQRGQAGGAGEPAVGGVDDVGTGGLAPNVLGTAKFDLTLGLAATPEGMAGSIEYSLDLYEPDTIARMAGHLVTLLEGIAADPDLPLGRLPLLPDEERRRMLVEWNETAAPLPPVCLHELVEAQVERTPEAVAVASDGVELAYRELDERANRLAHRLRELGVGPETRVGICLERSPALPVALLGVLKSGGAYVPLDPDYPPDRLAFMLEDARVPVLVTQPGLDERLPPRETVDVRLDLDGHVGGAHAEPAGRPESGVRPDNLCYVIYTSGSTGRPKGLAMPHRAMTNLVSWQVGPDPEAWRARTAQFTSLSFDVSCQEIVSTWASGGTLVLLDEERRTDAERFLAWLGAERVERLFCAFVALNQLALAYDGSPSSLRLRDVIVAGEQLRVTPELARLFADLPECTLRNQYGPTETHIVSELELEGPPSDWPPLPPIGRPLANIRFHVLDRGFEPAPIGVPGELYVSGAGVARGYLERPGLTAERFVPDPFAAEPGERLYRTGDLARYRPDGNVDYLGRLDHQVKVRGFRIEPGEIEAVLGEHPAVDEAAVVARDDGAGDRRLLAYVTSRDGEVDVASLRAFLRRRLADYMIPSAFVTLDALPLTPSGKVDRRALPDPDGARPELGERFVEPRTPTERLVASVWAELLGLDRVGVHDNFFELGGHSLLATQAIARIREALDADVPLRSLFDGPTVAELAAAADEIAADEPVISARPAAESVETLSDEQVRELLAERLRRQAGSEAL